MCCVALEIKISVCMSACEKKNADEDGQKTGGGGGVSQQKECVWVCERM